MQFAQGAAAIYGAVQGAHYGFQQYEGYYKERNDTHVKMFHSGCGSQETYYFTYKDDKTKVEKLDGPGGRQGKCGYKKDHARNYCCQKCFKEGRHKKIYMN